MEKAAPLRGLAGFRVRRRGKLGLVLRVIEVSMFSTKARRVFQLDGLNGGVLSIAEKPAEGRVLLVISQGDQEVQIALNKDDFEELAGLKYSLRFSVPEQPQAEPTLKAVA